MKNNVECATVLWFKGNKEKPEKSFGFAETDSGEQIYIGILGCRMIVAGAEEEPEFGNPWNQWPSRYGGDHIRFVRSEREPRRGQVWSAYQWGYESYWQKAENEIFSRPYDPTTYRVVVISRRFNGQSEKINPGTCVTAEGTLEVLQSKYPRLPMGENDRLGPVYKSGPVTESQIWQKFVRTDGDKDIYELCDDQRFLPHGIKLPVGDQDDDQKPRAVHIVVASSGNGDGHKPEDVVSEELIVLANSAGGRRAGTVTVRPS